MSNTARTIASRDAIRRALGTIPASARQGGAVADAMMVRCGMALLARIKTAFVIKARGGTDDAGDSWKPLSPKTIAYSRTRQRGRGGRTKGEKSRSVRPSQALNKKQQERWWQVYRKQLAIWKGNKGHAAAVAWLVLKREGAKTLVDKYGHRQVEILRDTGLLLNSLSPGVASAERVFIVGRGFIIVGTNRKGAARHHKGVPGRLPQRRLWPDPKNWTPSWWADITDQVKQGLVDLAVSIARGTGG